MQCASATKTTQVNGVKLNERKSDYAKIPENRKMKRDGERLLKCTSHHNGIRSFYSVLWKNTGNSIIDETKGTLLIELSGFRIPSTKINLWHESLPRFLYRDMIAASCLRKECPIK